MADGVDRTDIGLEYRKCDRARHFSQFFENDQRVEIGQAKPAQFGRDVDTKKTHIGHFLDNRMGQRLVARLDPASKRRQFFLRKRPRGIAQCHLLFAQAKIHRALLSLIERLNHARTGKEGQSLSSVSLRNSTRSSASSKRQPSRPPSLHTAVALIG